MEDPGEYLRSVEIREFTPADAEAVEAVQAAAFSHQADMVVPLLRSLLALPPATSGLSLVAVEGEEVVGHAHFSRGILDAPSRLVEVSVLSPIGVRPDPQRAGVGRELIAEGLGMLSTRGVPAVFLEGSPAYYSRRRFVAATPLGFLRPSPRIPEAGFQVALLDAYEPWMTGTLVYDQVFWDHDAVGLRD